MKFKIFFVTLCLLFAGLTAHAAEERYIIKFNDRVQLYGTGEEKIPKDYLSVSADELQDYIDAGVVEYYEPDRVVELCSANWNLDAINADFPALVGCLGNDVRVGVIDSGILASLADLMEDGYNYLDDNTDVTDNVGHGTVVTSLIGSSNYGVAYKADIVPLKCFDVDVETYTSDLVDAVVGAVNDFDCDVINMSVCYPAQSEDYYTGILREKLEAAEDLGVIVVASVGNDESSVLNYPAGFDSVIGVGSVYQNTETLEYLWSAFSNYNESVFVVAPGEGLTVLGVDGLSGTSYAAPHVTALAAIAKCIDPDINKTAFAALIADTAVDLGATGRDEYYGYGLVDCEAALKKLIEGQDFHISPIEKSETGTKTRAVVYNNTGKDKTVYCIHAVFDADGNFVTCEPVEIEIGADAAYTFENTYSEGTVKYMVWESFQTFTPLANIKTK